MAVLVLSDSVYVEKVYFLAYEKTDWMAIISKAGPNAPWTGTYRFRYYKDDKAFDSKDKKSEYLVTGKDGSDSTRDHLVSGFDKLADVIALVQGPLFVDDRILVRGGAERCLELLRPKKWFQSRVEDKDGNVIEKEA